MDQFYGAVFTVGDNGSQIESALKELKRTHGLDQVGAVNTITDRILFHTASQPDIVRVSLICPYAELASYYKMWNTYYILDSSSLQTEQWQEYLSRRSFGVVPLSLKDEVYSNLPEQNYITFYRNLSVFSNVDDNESILLITLPEKILGSMLVAQGDAGDVYFTINENNIPISYECRRMLSGISWRKMQIYFQKWIMLQAFRTECLSMNAMR